MTNILDCIRRALIESSAVLPIARFNGIAHNGPVRFTQPISFGDAPNCEILGRLAAAFNPADMDGEVSVEASTEADSFRITVLTIGARFDHPYRSKSYHASYLTDPTLRADFARVVIVFFMEAIGVISHAGAGEADDEMQSCAMAAAPNNLGRS